MADGFVQKVAELEQALARVESSMHGAELERARALVAALLEVHRVALLDLRRVLGDTELSRIAAVEPSLAWLLACHEISSAELERALAVAEAKKARAEAAPSPNSGFVPITRLTRNRGNPAA